MELTDILQLTQKAALACVPYIGSGDRKLCDQVAVEAMREVFRNLPIKGTIVIGEGERDQAPMLYIGEKVGSWGESYFQWDIAVDPLEGTNLCAKAQGGALSVLALSPQGGIFKAPDIYMEKIAGGPALKGVIDLKKSVEENIRQSASALGKKVTDIVVAILNRPRHAKLIQSVYALKAKVYLIDDGDLSASIQTCLPEQSVDLMIGSGGSPEGVLSASALKCLGGEFQARLIFNNLEQKKRAFQMGVTQPDQIYSIDDLIHKPVIFCATGITTGRLLKGVSKKNGYLETESFYMDSQKNTYFKIHSHVKESL